MSYRHTPMSHHWVTWTTLITSCTMLAMRAPNAPQSTPHWAQQAETSRLPSRLQNSLAPNVLDKQLCSTEAPPCSDQRIQRLCHGVRHLRGPASCPLPSRSVNSLNVVDDQCILYIETCYYHTVPRDELVFSKLSNALACWTQTNNGSEKVSHCFPHSDGADSFS